MCGSHAIFLVMNRTSICATCGGLIGACVCLPFVRAVLERKADNFVAVLQSQPALPAEQLHGGEQPDTPIFRVSRVASAASTSSHSDTIPHTTGLVRR